MKKFYVFALTVLIAGVGQLSAQVRTEILLDKNWRFTRDDNPASAAADFNDAAWSRVSVPHDWAIYGPFDKMNDIQYTAIEQDGQTQPQEHAGRTGGLPFVGCGWYRLRLDSIPAFTKGKRATLLFDGAMSQARVYVNGREVAYQPYGYTPFHVDITDEVNARRPVTIAVRLENEKASSRWYPGAGLYRNVHLTVTDEVCVPTWGVCVTTPAVSQQRATVNVRTEISGAGKATGKDIAVKVSILNKDGLCVAQSDLQKLAPGDTAVEQKMPVTNPQLWSCESPTLYRAVSEVYVDGRLSDKVTTPFGIRSIEIVREKGFFLNGEKVIFKGVCNHHDLGPLGTAVNEAALRYRLRMLKDMGCNAIRTAHNIPSPDLVRLCDEMGLMVMAESFDEWKIAKMANGYHKFFDKWVEHDIANEVRSLRNSPSVMFWSIGNEIPEQTAQGGARLAHRLQELFHKYDPTRPCTQGMNNYNAFGNNFAAVMDVPGINYISGYYQDLYKKSIPQGILIGAETVSSFSSRGVYKLPVQRKVMPDYDDHQTSSYDVEHTSWSDLPEDNFLQYESLPYDMGEFVWTGFDYLGEPTPYYDKWPSHSSVFGIIDLAGLPKDRYYLYRSVWNPKAETLHILPHWNWAGHENDTVPVFVYTNYPTVELFINGKSQGKRSKDLSVTLGNSSDGDSYWQLKRLQRYRLMWMDTRYEPGTVKAVAYDEAGNKVAETEIHTAGRPYAIRMQPDRTAISADGKDLCFITVTAVDKQGNACPLADDMINFKVKGAGHYKAGANGDPTSLEQFHLPQMHLFNGKMQIIVQSSGKPGDIVIEATAKGLKRGRLSVKAQ